MQKEEESGWEHVVQGYYLGGAAPMVMLETLPTVEFTQPMPERYVNLLFPPALPAVW